MKLEDAKVGMHLHDPKGNVWEILDIDADSRVPCVYVRCINFVHPIGIMTTLRIDTEAKAYVGRWMYVDKRHLIVAPDSVVQQFKEYFATGHQCINVVTGLNKTKALRFVTQEQYDSIEVTLECLKPIPEVQHLTRDNIRAGMRVRTALDVEFIVVGYTDTYVQLLYDIHVICKDRQLKQTSAKICIDWADAPAIPVDSLTTNDFTVVE
jgi:hypothetical protein